MDVLPDDIFRLICVQLRHKRDFQTLYCCAQVSRRFSVVALPELYRICHVASSLFSDETSGPSHSSGSKQPSGGVKTPFFPLWVTLWRSILLSCHGRSVIPYCRYMQVLNLHELEQFIGYLHSLGRTAKSFFKDLPEFKPDPLKPQRVRFIETIHEIGDAITQQAPMLRELAGNVHSERLKTWITRLPELTGLQLWQGSTLQDGIESEISAHCPKFGELTLYYWGIYPSTTSDRSATEHIRDESVAKVLNGLRHQSLRKLEILKATDFGPQSLAALTVHSTSLTSLSLAGLQTSAIPALDALSCLQSLEILSLETVLPQSLARHLPIGWIQKLKNLRSISVVGFENVFAILPPVFLDPQIHLETVFTRGGNCDEKFFQALEYQKDLVNLQIDRSDSLSSLQSRACVESIGKLPSLENLRLGELSDMFEDEHIIRLANNSKQLKHLYVGGYNIGDNVWTSICQLKQLESLTFNAITVFQADFIEIYINQLGPGNKGLILTVMNQSPDCSIKDEVIDGLNEKIKNKVGGRFELIHFRDPESSGSEEFSD